MAWTTPWAWFAGKKPTTAEMTQLSDDIRWASGPRQGTPPASPQDGDEWYILADGTNGVVWRFKYNAGSASAFKWECVGAEPLTSFVNAPEGTTSTTYVDLATVGPQMAVPRAGDYEVDFGATISATTTQLAFLAAKRGAAAAADADAASIGSSGAVGAPGISVARKIVMTGLAASDVIKLQARVSAGTGTFVFRWLAIRPIRIS